MCVDLKFTLDLPATDAERIRMSDAVSDSLPIVFFVPSNHAHMDVVTAMSKSGRRREAPCDLVNSDGRYAHITDAADAHKANEPAYNPKPMSLPRQLKVCS